MTEINFKNNIIIFGASEAGKKAYNILIEFGFNVKFFVDNDSKKWGTTLFNRNINDPKSIYEINKEEDILIIASMYVGEISKQLDEMGFKGCYYDVYDFIYAIVRKEWNFFSSIDSEIFLDYRLNHGRGEPIYLLTLPNGMVLGGIETWSINTYNLLDSYKKDVYLLSLSNHNDSNLSTLEHGKYNVMNFTYTNKSYVQYLNHLVMEIDQFRPNVIVPNVSDDMYIASYILKRKYNRKFKLISILHSDIELYYIQNLRYQDIIDKFICVSDEITEKLVARLGYRKEDIYTLISPIRQEPYTKEYSNYSEPIKLGYVGRLVKPDKRVDKLIDLVELLEEKRINYSLEIVGEGNFYEIIYQYIQDRNLKHKVKLLGKVPNQLIYEFWRDKDIYINVSDLEGTSISMLEGLYTGAVPVLTDVSGVRKFVTHGENGFIVDIGDIESMVDYIQYLDRNRHLLPTYGGKISSKVSEVCDSDKFIDKFIRICEIY